MTNAIQLYKRAVLLEARKMAMHLEKIWPDISTITSLDTQEGEDAYMWITADEEIHDAVLDEAVGLTVDLYNEKAIYIVPRFHIRKREHPNDQKGAS